MEKEEKFSTEVRARAVRLVFEQSKDAASQWAAICCVAEKIGCNPEMLRCWIRQDESDHGTDSREGLIINERQELKRLRRQNRELKKANEILKLAAEYYAWTEINRHK